MVNVKQCCLPVTNGQSANGNQWYTMDIQSPMTANADADTKTNALADMMCRLPSAANGSSTCG